MIQSNSSIWNSVLKALLIAALLGFLYVELFVNEDIDEIWQVFKAQLSRAPWVLFAIAFGLVAANWALEAVKWKRLVDAFEPISVKRALAAVVAGLTVGLITPNRIGEYGGRVLLLRSENNWKGVAATLVCSIGQNIANLIFGMAGLCYFGYYYLHIPVLYLISLMAFVLVALSLVLLLYYNLEAVGRIVKKWLLPNWLKWLSKPLKIVRDLDAKVINRTVLLSACRYLVYLTQYVLVLYFFGVDIPFPAILTGVASIFLIQSGLPLPPVMGALARGELALLIWDSFELNALSVLASTFTVWIINLILPALLGLVIIFRINLMKSLGYGTN